MDLFPERADPRSSRRLVVAALIASLAVHLAIGGVWGFFGYRVAPVIAKLLPRPTPTPEIVALSDAITIEKRTVPPPRRRTPRTQPVRQQPRRLAEEPVPRTPAVPTLPPIPTSPPTSRPTTEPTAEPTYRPERGTIHHARAVPTEEPRPREVPTAAPAPAAKKGFSQQQIAALDAQFSKTIAQAQRSLVDTPPQRRPPARAPNQLRYEAVMSGTPEMYFSAQGDCTSIESGRAGSTNYYYLRCLIRYSDGYFEEVSFPWPHEFPRRNDPIDMYLRDGIRRPFLMQAPPAGFTLPPHFALSRAICTFYRAYCQGVIDRERANGNQPAPDRQ